MGVFTCEHVWPALGVGISSSKILNIFLDPEDFTMFFLHILNFKHLLSCFAYIKYLTHSWLRKLGRERREKVIDLVDLPNSGKDKQKGNWIINNILGQLCVSIVYFNSMMKIKRISFMPFYRKCYKWKYFFW